MKIKKILLLFILLFLYLLGYKYSINNEPSINDDISTSTIKKVAYIPMDDRPVNTDRVIYLVESLGYELLMPESDYYKTRLDKQPLNTNQTSYGDMEKLIKWLEEIDTDMYIISLDQLLSGGLVNSRCMIESDLQNSYERIDKLITIIEDKNTVVFDTVMRLASTIGYNNYTSNEYSKLREYASISRPILDSNSLMINTIINSYRLSQDYKTITTSLSKKVIDDYLRARERKLRLTDYFLDNVKGLKNCYTYIGVDDSSPNNTIQTNEINYLKTKITNGTLFAGCDELGLMSVTKLAITDTKTSLSANITYIGGGENLPGDAYDIGSLKENVEVHLSSLNVSNDQQALLQILVLTKPKIVSTKEANVDKLLELYRKYIDNKTPVILIDASSYTNYGILQSRLLDEDLSYLLGYSNWNTVGNAIGIALSNGLSRYIYLQSKQNKEQANLSFIKTISYSLLKDISYKITGQGLVKEYIKNNVGDINNFYSTLPNESINNEKLQSILMSSNYAQNMIDVINKLRSTNFITNIDNAITERYDVKLSNFSFPWYRTFEIRFLITVEYINEK